MQHERASKAFATLWRRRTGRRVGREREGESGAFQESFLPLDKSIFSMEGERRERARHCSLRCPLALRPRYHSCIRAFGLPAGSRASVPEALMGESMEGTSEADQYYLFRVGAPSQSGQYGIKGKRPLSVPPSIDFLLYHQASQGKVFSGVSCATGNKRICSILN